MITLPWPPRELSPNSRKDRRHIGDIRRAYRDAGFFAAKEAAVLPRADSHLSVTFHPPDRRRRDLDNMLASAKHALDGVALAAGVDDYGWSLSIRRAEPVKGGCVTISYGEDNWQHIADLLPKIIKGDVT